MSQASRLGYTDAMSAFDPIPRSVYQDRRRRIAEALGSDVMVLPAAPARTASRDTEHPYRPDSDLFWATGLTEPETVAVLKGDGQGTVETTLFVRPRDPQAETWTGPRMGVEVAGEWVGADTCVPIGRLHEMLPGLLDSARLIHYRMGAGSTELQGQILLALERGRSKGPRKGGGSRGVLDPGAILDELRLRKDAYEIARMRHAANLTTAGFREMLATARNGVGEWELEATLEAAFRRSGASGPAYESIVGSGVNACTLHYVLNRDVVQTGSLVLVDAGAVWDLYCGDVTRTFPVDGRFTPEQLDVYQVVEAAREAAISQVRPGSTMADVHHAASEVLAEGLQTLGVLAGSPAEIMASDAFKSYYPHQTSHWLGLDVHDVGDYAVDGRSRVLEPGMVLTVEPGLYFSPRDRGMDAPFSGIGIRIEDDVLVTDEGHENLTAELPTAADKLVEMVGA